MKRTPFLLLLLVTLLLLLPYTHGCKSAPVWNKKTADLMHGLKSKDADARAKAVSTAPDAGPEAVEPVTQLLSHENPGIALHAKRALWAMAHHACRPGAKEERTAISRAMSLLVCPQLDFPNYSRLTLLRLLALTANDESSITLVASCMDDKTAWEMAVWALQRIRHRGAEKALIVRLKNGPEFQRAALANALGAKKSKASVPILLTTAESGEGDVKGSALHALALIGDTRAKELLLREASGGTPEGRENLLIFAERRMALRAKGEALQIYQSLLNDEASHIRAAAVHGFGQSERPACLPVLLAKLGDSSPDVRAAAQRELVTSQCEGIAGILQKALEADDASIRSSALRILASREEIPPEELVYYFEKDRNVRVTILELLGKFDHPEVEKILSQASASSTEAERGAAQNSYLLYGKRRLHSGDKEKALEIFHLILRGAESPSLIASTLAGIQAVASPSSLSEIQSLEENPEYTQEVAKTRIAIASTLAESDPARAVRVLDQVCSATSSRTLRRMALAKLRKLGVDTKSYSLRSGFLLDWKLMGSFPAPTDEDWDTHPFGPDGPTMEEEMKVDGRRIQWGPFTTEDPDGIVDLLRFEPHENVAAYGVAEIRWPEKGEAILKVGSDDGVVLWLNNELVHSNRAWRGLDLDQDEVSVTFRKGLNRILIKVSQGGGDWGFCLRIADAQGEPFDLTKNLTE